MILDRRLPEISEVLRQRVKVVQGDIRDRDSVGEAISAGTEAVFHLAAVTSVLKSKENPDETFDVNLSATSILLERARQAEVPTFVMASTNAVAGDVGDDKISENTVPAPLTPYGATKAGAEMLMSAYSSSFAMKCAAVRLTNVYGPGMKEKDSFVPRLMRAAMDGSSVTIYGDGEQVRDFVYVRDAVDGILLSADLQLAGPLTIGSGISVSVLDLHKAVCRAAGTVIPIEHGDPKPGEMRAVRVDISRARSIGFSPQVDMERGLSLTWADMKSDGTLEH